MMVAMPNQDKSWTVTLFLPFATFDYLDCQEKLLQFFDENFKDAIQLIGKERLISDFFNSKPSPLISIKVFYSNTFLKQTNLFTQWADLLRRILLLKQQTKISQFISKLNIIFATTSLNLLFSNTNKHLSLIVKYNNVPLRVYLNSWAQFLEIDLKK